MAIKNEKDMSRDEILKKLEYLKNTPQRNAEEIGRIRQDRQKARKGFIWPCIIFGIVILFEFIQIFIHIFSGTATTENILIAVMIIIMNSIFVCYECLLYRDRIALADMYQLNLELSSAWTKTFCDGLEREAKLTEELKKLRGEKNGKKN